MIKAFHKITGTGIFLNYQPEAGADVADFQHINLIYGENGSGKTTLSLILQSLKGDDELLLKKRSFHHGIPQEIELKTDLPNAPVFHFSNNRWDRHCPDIEIFNIHFINDNIYAGMEIQPSHRKNLFEVILGEEGVRLKKEIQAIRERIQNGNKVVRETMKVIEMAIGDAFTARDFAGMDADRHITDRIAEKEHELETARNFQAILSTAYLAELPAFALPFNEALAEALLKQSIDRISEKYLQKFKEHKTSLGMGGAAEEWIKKGYEAIHDETCPFCLRPFDDTVEIVEAYKQYFNEAYNQLLKGISRVCEALGHFNPEALLLEIENRITANLALISFWKNYLPSAPALQSVLSEKSALLTAFNALKASFDQKSRNPVQAQDPEALHVFQKLAGQLVQQLGEFNRTIVAFNSSISLMKSAEVPSVPQLDLELKQLQALKKRDEPELAAHCDNLLKYEDAISILKTNQKFRQQELDHYKDSIFKKYLGRINHYLKAYAPYLELRNLGSAYLGSAREPFVKFALCVQGHEVEQKDHDSRPTVRFSMSEGDKSALALAFFLAKLDSATDLKDKVIVVDDPVSSFDRLRLNRMLDDLLHFGKEATQLFFLTHNYRLGEEFLKRARQTGLPCGHFRMGMREGSAWVLVEK